MDGFTLPPIALLGSICSASSIIQRPSSRVNPFMNFDPHHRFTAATPREERIRHSFFLTQRSPRSTATPQTARCGPSSRGSVDLNLTARSGVDALPAAMVGATVLTLPSMTPAPRAARARIAGDAVVKEDIHFVATETAAFELAHIHSKKVHARDVAHGDSVDVLSSSGSDDDEPSMSKAAMHRATANRNELIKMLFQHRLTVQTTVARELLARDMDALRRDFMLIITRYGMRQMTAEDFHNVLMDVLCLDDLAFADSKTIFELFDANHSGLLDVDELMDGLRLLMIDEETLILMFCRKVIMEPRNFRDTMLSFDEVSVLLKSVVRFYRRDAAIVNDVERVLSEVWRHAHNGSVTVPLLRNLANHTSTLRSAVALIPTDGRDIDRHATAAATPPPDDVLLGVAEAHGSVAAAQRRKAEQQRILERRRSERPQRRGSNVSAASDSSAARSSVKGDESEASDADPAGSSPKPPRTPAGAGGRRRTVARAPLIAEAIDVHHPKFRADLCKHENLQRQLAATETLNPTYFTVRGQVYRKTDVSPAEPVFEA